MSKEEIYPWIGAAIGGFVGLLILIPGMAGWWAVLLNTVIIGAFLGWIGRWIIGEGEPDPDDPQPAFVFGIIYWTYTSILWVFYCISGGWGILSMIFGMLIGCIIISLLVAAIAMKVANIFEANAFGCFVGGAIGSLILGLLTVLPYFYTNEYYGFSIPYFAIPLFAYVGHAIGVPIKEKSEMKRKEELERERRRKEEQRRISEIRAKYEQYKREGYEPDEDLEEMLK